MKPAGVNNKPEISSASEINTLVSIKKDLICKDHYPVLLNEVLNILHIKDHGLYLDATFGAGGYSTTILSENKTAKVVAFDVDDTVLPHVARLKKEYGERFEFVKGNFRNMKQLLAEKGVSNFDGIVFDLGVSSMQLDQKERGFSFSYPAKLDMRMDTTLSFSAYELVNRYSEKDLADVIYQYGEEQASRKIAKNIVKARGLKPIETTKELAEIIYQVLPVKNKNGTNSATKTFQAIRIAVNDELGALKEGIAAAKDLLQLHGVLAVVSFHSLEDKIVKDFFAKLVGKEEGFSRYMPSALTVNSVTDIKDNVCFELLNKKPISAGDMELIENNRSRSAKLRAVKRIA